MVYVSSACIKQEKIRDSIEALVRNGFKNIELTAGTKYYSAYEQDLIELKKKYDINFLIHNYFPPPKNLFVLNLASLNDDIFRKSIELCKNAIRLSKKIGSKRYGVHAGFLIDLKPEEVGEKINYNPLSNRMEAIKRFCEAWDRLKDEADNDVSLYIENNVLSRANAETFRGTNPFLLTDYGGYLELKEHIKFNLLVDVAHLKVSAKSLGLDFKQELKNLVQKSDYLHLSENDGFHDQNKPIEAESLLMRTLKDFDLKNKIITLEVYADIDKLISSYKAVESSLKSFNKSSHNIKEM